MRGHVGCIFKATEGYTTGVWWAFYVRIMDTCQWPLCDLGGEKKTKSKTKNTGHPSTCLSATTLGRNTRCGGYFPYELVRIIFGNVFTAE
jgi:hypothetical protein